MTNTPEGNEPEITDETLIAAQDVAVDASEDPDVFESYAEMDGEWDQPEMAYRVLNWLYVNAKAATAHTDLSGYSAARRAAVGDLVRNGLVRERIWTSGEQDGRHSLTLTELGMARLHAAWDAARLVVIG